MFKLNRFPPNSFVVAVTTLLLLQTTHAQEQLADVIERCEKSVMRIEVSGVGGGGLGSGFVVDADGLIVTNVHVLAGADRAKVVFPDGTSYDITGTYFIDENRDICVAKIDASGLTPISLASSLPRKGEQVVALGSPKGLSFSATRGIVSAIRDEADAKQQLGRPNIEGTWVQIDAALSGGNSGGPLINSKGEVVAMSTLASQGSAQNLNFGISVDDVRRGIDQAKQAGLIALKSGVAKIDMGEIQPVSGELITRGAIPETALENYLERGRDQYNDLSRRIKKEYGEARKLLSAFKRGEDYIPGGSQGADVVVRKGRNTDRYYFRNSRVKELEVSRQQRLVDDYKDIVDGLSSSADDNSLLTILMKAGPRLDTRDANSIGFMDKGIVLHAYNEHDIVVLYDGVPYLMWVKETTGLAPGEEVSPGPVYVAGTETLEVPGRGTIALTILNSVMETEVRKVIDGTAVDLSEFRTWSDTTGQFQIDAKLVESDGTNVVLKKRDGTLLTVAINQLSKEDAALIKK